MTREKCGCEIEATDPCLCNLRSTGVAQVAYPAPVAPNLDVHAKDNLQSSNTQSSNGNNTFIEVLDYNGLYPSIISGFPLPCGPYTYVDPKNVDVMSLSPLGNYNYLLEVDIGVPLDIHRKNDPFPFFPEHLCAPASKTKKLMLTLKSKKNYVVLLNNLLQGLENGYTLEKVHKILRFGQSYWLKPFIDGNNDRRIAATCEATSALEKLVSNSFFGRCAIDKTRHRDVLYISDEAKMQKLVKKFNFANRKILAENLCLVEMRKNSVVMDTLFPVAMVILELSKLVMYNFWSLLRNHFGEKIFHYLRLIQIR